MSFYIYKNSEQTGPFDESFVERELQAGNLSPMDLACIENSGEWSPLATFFPNEAQFQSAVQMTRHAVPKCLCCGAITEWKIEPVFLPRHWVIFIILLCSAGAGLIYLPLIYVIRSNPNSRAKICPACGARNMWTFQY